MTSVSYQNNLSIEVIKLYDLYPYNSIKKRKQIDCNTCLFIMGGNCIRMYMGKFLSNKIVTVTDA